MTRTPTRRDVLVGLGTSVLAGSTVATAAGTPRRSGSRADQADEVRCSLEAATGAAHAAQVVTSLYGDAYADAAGAAQVGAVDGVTGVAGYVPGSGGDLCGSTAYGATMGAILGGIPSPGDIEEVAAAARGAATAGVLAAVRYPTLDLTLSAPYVVYPDDPADPTDAAVVNYVPLVVCPTQGAASGALERRRYDPGQGPETTERAAGRGVEQGVRYYRQTSNRLCNDLLNRARTAALFYGLDG